MRIAGTLAKFEPTEAGVTITIKADAECLSQVVQMYKSYVSVALDPGDGKTHEERVEAIHRGITQILREIEGK